MRTASSIEPSTSSAHVGLGQAASRVSTRMLSIAGSLWASVPAVSSLT
jgi:hypothetical protein